MAKNEQALLQDISSQLRKLNQVSIKDKLQEREANERQDANFALLGAGGSAAQQDGENWIDATEDFRRRFTAGRAGTIFDNQYLPSEKLAKKVLQQTLFTEMVSHQAATNWILQQQAKWPLWKMLDTHLQTIISLMRGTPLLDEENRREGPGPGQHPNSIKHRIQKGWNADESELDKPPEKEKKTWIQKLLGYPKTAAIWVVTAVGKALYDVIDGYDKGGFSGAVAGFFGGSGEGGLTSSIIGAFKGAGIGIGAGFIWGATGGSLGGPVGALVGGLLGAVSFAILGAIGADKIKAWMDEAGKNISDSWDEIKTNFGNLTDKIGSWIYTPGEGTSATGGFKSKMFGGLIEWNPTKESGETLSSAWLTVVAKLEAAPGKFATWFEGKVRNIFGDKLGDILFGDSPETIAKKALLIGNPHIGEAIISKSLSKSILEEEVEARINEYAARGDVFTGIGSDTMNAIIAAANGPAVDANGDVIKVGGKLEEGGVIESLLDSARETYLAIGAYRARNQAITDLGAADYSKPTIIYDDKSDKSTTTTIINTSTYIDTATSEILGSGNNSQVYQSESGNIYSWQP